MKKFSYCGMQFAVGDDVANYAEAWKDNIAVQREKMNEFAAIYRSYGSMDTAVQRACDDLWNLFSAVVEEYVNYWIEDGYYDLSPESFFKNYYLPKYPNQQLQIQTAYDELEEKYSKIVLSQEQQEEYRRLRKANRGRWQGGGFGVGGALKGAATAGAMNMVTGIGHGVVNTIGNIGTSIATAGKKRKLYEDEETLVALQTALSNDIFYILTANIKFAMSHTRLKYKERYHNECEKARTILKNISNFNLPEKEYNKAIFQVFDLDPYNPELYRQLLIHYGDMNHELEQIADFFGALESLKEYKNQILLEISGSEKAETYLDYERLLEKMEESAKFYGIDETNSPVFKETQENYKRLELEARTFENIVYDSVEEAQKARKEKEELDKIINLIDFSSETALAKGLEEIKGYPAAIWDKDPYIKKISDSLHEMIKSREQKQFESIMVTVNQLDKSSLIRAREQLNSAQFSLISVTEPLQKLDQAIENFDINIRTVNGTVYETLEEAEKARKEAQSCETLIGKIDKTEEDSILDVWDQLKRQKFQFINPQNYFDTVQSIYQEYKENFVPITQNKCLKKQDGFLAKRDFVGAIQCINDYELEEPDKKVLFDSLNEKAKKILAAELSQAQEYEKDHSGFGTILLGAIFFIVVGFFLSNIFQPAFIISVILAVCGIIGYFMEGKEREAKKKSYEFICELERLGYDFGIKNKGASN